jgi:hypothetical protein
MSAESDRHCINLELATGWAVHALEPDDEVAFARHLPGCAECEAEVQATEDVAVLLAADVEQLDPPAHLRAAVLNAARSPQVPRQSHPVGMTPRELAPVAQRRSPQRRSSRSAGRFSTSRRNLVAAASAVVLALGAVAGWAGTTVFNQQGSTSVSALDEQNVMLALTDPSVRKVALTDKGSTTPMALLLAGPNGSTVLPVHMPAVASSSQYVLWGVPDGAGAKPVPLGGVSRDGDAHGARSVAAMSPSAPASFTRFAVSIEPAGSTPIAPTTTVATGDAQA